MKINLAVLIFIFSFSVFSAIESAEKLNVFEMKRKLQEQNKMIQEMNREVNQVEMNLGLQNKKYLRLANERSKIEEMLAQAKKNADLDSQNLTKNFNETKTILMGVLLNKLEKNESSADLLSRKILIENLQRRLSDLDGMMKSNKAIQEDVDKLSLRLEDSMKTEKDLLALTAELEQRKKELHTNIEMADQKKSSTQAEFDEVKNKLAMERDALHKASLKEKLRPVQITEEIKIPSQPEAGVRSNTVAGGAGFGPPIADFLGIDYQKKELLLIFKVKMKFEHLRVEKLSIREVWPVMETCS